MERARGDARWHDRVPVDPVPRRPAGAGDGGGRDPPGLVRPVPDDEAPAFGAGHGVGAVHRAQDGPRLPDGAARHVGQARQATERVLPRALLRRAVPGGERLPGDGGHRHRTPGVRLRLPARRGPARARPLRESGRQAERRRPASDPAREPGALPRHGRVRR